jgi:glycosyltransferase involved in cell wall biosynthesis
MQILLLSRYGEMSATTRMRFSQYLPYLNAQGIHVTSTPLLNDDALQQLYQHGRRDPLKLLGSYIRRIALLLQAKRYDAIWLEKELFPLLPAWGERWLAQLGIPYLVDYDDATFHFYDNHPKAWVRQTLGRKIEMVMQHAALVVAGNAYLAEHAQAAGAQHITLLPTVVDAERYQPAPNPSPQFTVGWIGSPSTAKYLRMIAPALSQVIERGGRVLVVGAGNTEIGIQHPHLEQRDWAEAREISDIQAMDVGIMPLPDDLWERGKCGYKLIQYMACGKAVVASPVGVNSQIVRADNGYLAQDIGQWDQALARLQGDATLRTGMGARGRAIFAAEYALQVTAPKLAACFAQIQRNRA